MSGVLESQRTVPYPERRFNGNARKGTDPDFNRGGGTYDRNQGDDEVQPNPCLAPLRRGPFYAVRLYAAEIGTFAGIRTDASARVVDEKGRPTPDSTPSATTR